jgi:Flavodoxins
MNIAVRYVTKTGNTKKLAEAVAQETGSEALSVEHGIAQDTDILFLGASVYGAGIDPRMTEFIQGLDGKVKKVAVFSTAALLTSAYPQIKKLLDQKNIPVAAQEFHCRGQFKMLHRGRPNAADVDEIRKFAREMIGK